MRYWNTVNLAELIGQISTMRFYMTNGTRTNSDKRPSGVKSDKRDHMWIHA